MLQISCSKKEPNPIIGKWTDSVESFYIQFSPDKIVILFKDEIENTSFDIIRTGTWETDLDNQKLVYDIIETHCSLNLDSLGVDLTQLKKNMEILDKVYSNHEFDYPLSGENKLLTLTNKYSESATLDRIE